MSIYQAVQRKDFQLAKELLTSQVTDFNDLKPFEKSGIIQQALRAKAFEILEVLMEHDLIVLDVYELDRWLGSFFHEAIMHLPFILEPKGFGPNRPVVTDPEELDQNVLQFFEKVCAKADNLDEALENQTLLDYAISKNLPIPVLDIIVNAGCPVDRMDASENTLLFKKLQAPVIEWLIGHGLNVNHRNKGNETPLLKSIQNNQLEVVKAFLDNGADLNYKDKEGNSLFHIALVDVVSYELFDLLCEYDQPNLEEFNITGSSLLFNYLDRMYAFNPQVKDYLEKLIAMGGNVLQVNKTIYGVSKTPLELSIGKGFDVFETLLAHCHEDINQTDEEGNTLLHKVCAFSLNHDQNKAKELYKIVKLLLGKGADTSIRNTNDKTAMDLAMDDNLKEKVVAILLKSA
jgi:ankyrin repeat protein